MIIEEKKLDSPKFTIGELVKHRYYPFRGVIFDVDQEVKNGMTQFQKTKARGYFAIC